MSKEIKTSREITLPGAGGKWTKAEEELLYEETAAGLSVNEIAVRHRRSEGGIRSRQCRLGLREERSGELLDPLPPFQPFTKTNRHSRPSSEEFGSSIEIPVTRQAADPIPVTNFAPIEKRMKEVTSKAVEWPDEFPGVDDPIGMMWAAIEWDIFTYVGRRKNDAGRERAQEILLTRITPSDDFRSQATLEELGEVYGVSRERIRQIEVQGRGILDAGLRARKRMLAKAIDRLLASNCDDVVEQQYVWLIKQLLDASCNLTFAEYVLTAFGRMCARHTAEIERVVSAYRLQSKMIHRQSHRQARRQARTDKSTLAADEFVTQVLSQARFSGSEAAEGVDLSGLAPLRSCRGEREAYVRSLGRLVRFESCGEHKLIRALDRCSVIDQFAEQSVVIPYKDGGKDRTYFPDFIVRTTEGIVIVIEVKARPQLADRLVQIKARAAEEQLGRKGIGYCLVDAEGTSAQDILQIEAEEPLKAFLRGTLLEIGVVRFADLQAYSGGCVSDSELDQVQSLVLAHGLDYRTTLNPAPESSMGYHFDFELKLSNPTQ